MTTGEKLIKWDNRIPDDQWVIYKQAMDAAYGVKVPFLLGGTFGLAAYTDIWRETKDMDFFIKPENKDKLIDAFTKAGFEDYYDQLPYDRNWIYRSTKHGMIVDIIWMMANRRAVIDEVWFQHALPVQLHGEHVRIIPMEELFWCKLYIMQHDRCDWPDLLCVAYMNEKTFRWEHLFERLGNDLPLLASIISILMWVSPRKARELPDMLYQKLGITKPLETITAEEEKQRRDFLDSRDWLTVAKL